MVGYAFSFIQNPDLNTQKDKQEIKMEQKDKREWLFCCLCNSLFPALVVYDNWALFFLFNAALFVYLCYSAFKEL